MRYDGSQTTGHFHGGETMDGRWIDVLAGLYVLVAVIAALGILLAPSNKGKPKEQPRRALLHSSTPLLGYDSSRSPEEMAELIERMEIIDSMPEGPAKMLAILFLRRPHCGAKAPDRGVSFVHECSGGRLVAYSLSWLVVSGPE
jgi:hypothetical protein